MPLSLLVCAFLTFKASTGHSRILATSKATLPCPRTTAVSQLRSGLSWIKDTWKKVGKVENTGENDWVALSDTTSHLLTVGHPVVPAHEVFGWVHTSQVLSWNPHAAVSLCPVTLSDHLDETKRERQFDFYIQVISSRRSMQASCSHQDHGVVRLLQFADTYVLTNVHVAVEAAAWVFSCLRESIDDILIR